MSHLRIGWYLFGCGDSPSWQSTSPSCAGSLRTSPRRFTPLALSRLRPLGLGPFAPSGEKFRVVGNENGAIPGVAKNGDVRFSLAGFVSHEHRPKHVSDSRVKLIVRMGRAYVFGQVCSLEDDLPHLLPNVYSLRRGGVAALVLPVGFRISFTAAPQPSSQGGVYLDDAGALPMAAPRFGDQMERQPALWCVKRPDPGEAKQGPRYRPVRASTVAKDGYALWGLESGVLGREETLDRPLGKVVRYGPGTDRVRRAGERCVPAEQRLWSLARFLVDIVTKLRGGLGQEFLAIVNRTRFGRGGIDGDDSVARHGASL